MSCIYLLVRYLGTCVDVHVLVLNEFSYVASKHDNGWEFHRSSPLCT